MRTRATHRSTISIQDVLLKYSPVCRGCFQDEGALNRVRCVLWSTEVSRYLFTTPPCLARFVGTPLTNDTHGHTLLGLRWQHIPQTYHTYMPTLCVAWCLCANSRRSKSGAVLWLWYGHAWFLFKIRFSGCPMSHGKSYFCSNANWAAKPPGTSLRPGNAGVLGEWLVNISGDIMNTPPCRKWRPPPSRGCASLDTPF